MTPEEQKDKVWEALLQHSGRGGDESRPWPSYDKLMADMNAADYHHTLTCPHDLLLSEDTLCPSKSLCPHGAVYCAKIELFPSPDGSTPYSGLLSPGTTLEHCLLRLSSAMKPPDQEIKSKLARAVLYATGEKLRTAKLFPCAALKVFRSGQASGNLLFGGSKVGQREADYFAHCQCTSMTEQMPRMVRPIVNKFWRYSNHPLSLGVSDFCRFAEDGTEASYLQFPFAVILKPLLNDDTHASHQVFEDSFDGFLDKVLHISSDTPIFDIYVCPDPASVPDPSQLQRIGRITSTTEMVQSAPNDGIFFRHQRKEEDYDARPEWRGSLNEQVTIDNGSTKGTIGKLTGWKLFEQHINEGTYVDFET